MTHSSPTGIRAVCIAGPSDAGKTTLVEQLVPRVAEYGPVGTIKSIHHEIEIDTPGADTHRHRTAGADVAVGITPTLTFEIAETGKRTPEKTAAVERLFDAPLEEADDELIALANALERLEGRGLEYVLVEGFSETPLPTILVGDRTPAAVGGEVIGRGSDARSSLVEAIRTTAVLGSEE